MCFGGEGGRFFFLKHVIQIRLHNTVSENLGIHILLAVYHFSGHVTLQWLKVPLNQSSMHHLKDTLML